MAYEDAGQFLTSASRTTSSNSGAVLCPKGSSLNLLVEVTAQSGTTPTLDLTVEWSADGVNFAVSQPADSFTQITTVTPTRVVKQFAIKAPFFRLVWALGGTTPNYTFQATRYASGQ